MVCTHKISEINQEVITPSYVAAAKKFDLEFQPSTFTKYATNNNQLHVKKIKNIFFKYFNQ